MTFARTLALGVIILLVAVAGSPVRASDIEVKIDNFTFNPKQVTVYYVGLAASDNQATPAW